MSAFAYQAVDGAGKRLQGELEAPDPATPAGMPLARALDAASNVRVICRDCGERTRPDGDVIRSLGVGDAELTEVVRGRGCDRCRGTGFRGRTGIYELLVLDDALRFELQQQRGAGELRRLAVAHGMRTLREDGLRQIRAGVTTPEEVVRVTQA